MSFVRDDKVRFLQELIESPQCKSFPDHMRAEIRMAIVNHPFVITPLRPHYAPNSKSHRGWRDESNFPTPKAKARAARDFVDRKLPLDLTYNLPLRVAHVIDTLRTNPGKPLAINGPELTDQFTDAVLPDAICKALANGLSSPIKFERGTLVYQPRLYLELLRMYSDLGWGQRLGHYLAATWPRGVPLADCVDLVGKNAMPVVLRDWATLIVLPKPKPDALSQWAGDVVDMLWRSDPNRECWKRVGERGWVTAARDHRYHLAYFSNAYEEEEKRPVAAAAARAVAKKSTRWQDEVDWYFGGEELAREITASYRDSAFQSKITMISAASRSIFDVDLSATNCLVTGRSPETVSLTPFLLDLFRIRPKQLGEAKELDPRWALARDMAAAARVKPAILKAEWGPQRDAAVASQKKPQRLDLARSEQSEAIKVDWLTGMTDDELLRVAFNKNDLAPILESIKQQRLKEARQAVKDAAEKINPQVVQAVAGKFVDATQVSNLVFHDDQRALGELMMTEWILTPEDQRDKCFLELRTTSTDNARFARSIEVGVFSGLDDAGLPAIFQNNLSRMGGPEVYTNAAQNFIKLIIQSGADAVAGWITTKTKWGNGKNQQQKRLEFIQSLILQAKKHPENSELKVPLKERQEEGRLTPWEVAFQIYESALSSLKIPTTGPDSFILQQQDSIRTHQARFKLDKGILRVRKAKPKRGRGR